MKSYVTYLRVSTQKQGQSGLGLEAQRYAVQAFSQGTTIVGEFVEVESGKKNARPQLASAIALAKAKGATLLIAKLDRLSRNAGFIFQLRDTGVDFVCCDMPDANTLTVGIFAVLAQHERELISQRTKAALAAKKTQGAQLGTPANLTREATQKGRASNQCNALTNEQNERAAAHILLLKEKGFNYSHIAEKLNALRFLTRTGKQFRAEQVKRLYLRAIASSVTLA
jgi:DNA invertase Pin-like site-specific DNA recombinase